MSADARVVGYCRVCGKPLDEGSVRNAQGTVFCAEHAPQDPASEGPRPAPRADPSPYTSTSPLPDVSPGLAFVLGFIPGVGAIYNGQYAKGLVHAVIIGLIITLMSDAPGNMEPLLAFLMIGFWIYMPFEAFHTARKRQLGESVDEFSSLVPMHASAAKIPIAPIVLILLGVVFLMNNLEIVELQRVLRFWPVALILAGAYMLYARASGAGGQR